MKYTITKELTLPDPKAPQVNHEWQPRGYGWVGKRGTPFACFNPSRKVSGQWFYSSGVTNADPELFYLELVRTHRDDGTPLEIPELPEVRGYIEYSGKGMRPEDMGDANNYAALPTTYTHHCWVINRDGVVPLGEKETHYARVWDTAPVGLSSPTLPLNWKCHMHQGVWSMSRKQMEAFGCDGFIYLKLDGTWSGVMRIQARDEQPRKIFYVPVYKVALKRPKLTKLSDLIGDGQRIAYLIHFERGVRQFVLDHRKGVWRDVRSGRTSLMTHFRWSHSPKTAFKDANEFIF